MTFDDLMKVLQSGGNVLLPFALWIAWSAMNKAKEAVDTLKSIDTGMKGLREENRENFDRIDRELVDVAKTLEFLPAKLQALRR